jgi:hypothetical protein
MFWTDPWIVKARSDAVRFLNLAVLILEDKGFSAMEKADTAVDQGT